MSRLKEYLEIAGDKSNEVIKIMSKKQWKELQKSPGLRGKQKRGVGDFVTNKEGETFKIDKIVYPVLFNSHWVDASSSGPGSPTIKSWPSAGIPSVSWEENIIPPLADRTGDL